MAAEDQTYRVVREDEAMTPLGNNLEMSLEDALALYAQTKVGTGPPIAVRRNVPTGTEVTPWRKFSDPVPTPFGKRNTWRNQGK